MFSGFVLLFADPENRPRIGETTQRDALRDSRASVRARPGSVPLSGVLTLTRIADQQGRCLLDNIA